MANKLENLRITKVAFVPEGDNPKADVLLFKAKDDNEHVEDSLGSESGSVTSQDTVLKRVLVAIGKALGFEEKEIAGASLDDGTERSIEYGKGGLNLKIDKSKMTQEELEILTTLEKKYGIQEDAATTVNEAEVNKRSAETESENSVNAESMGSEVDGIYKGIHPEIQAELERLRKFADEAEEGKLIDIAKRYEIIGKKPAELVPVLKSLKAAGGDAYSQMIAVLDATVEAVEKSGLFSEIGKKGYGEQDAWAAIETKADEIMKAAPTMTRAAAIEKACEQNPELVYAYENQR